MELEGSAFWALSGYVRDCCVGSQLISSARHHSDVLAFVTSASHVNNSDTFINTRTLLVISSSAHHRRHPTIELGSGLAAGNQAAPVTPHTSQTHVTHIPHTWYPHPTHMLLTSHNLHPCHFTGRAGVCSGQWMTPQPACIRNQVLLRIYSLVLQPNMGRRIYYTITVLV